MFFITAYLIFETLFESSFSNSFFGFYSYEIVSSNVFGKKKTQGFASIQRNVTQRNAKPRHATPRHATPRNATQRKEF